MCVIRSQLRRDRSKRAANELKLAAGERRSDELLDAAAKLLLETRAADLLSEARNLNREARQLLNSQDRADLQADAERLAHMASANPRRFFRALQNRLPEPAGTYDESAGPNAEKCASFHEFFARLLQRTVGSPPDGGGNKYDECFPKTDDATHAMLHAPVLWQEVYALLYPVHKDAVRGDPCLPECKLCPLFAEHVGAFEPGDTSMTLLSTVLACGHQRQRVPMVSLLRHSVGHAPSLVMNVTPIVEGYVWLLHRSSMQC